MSFRQYGGINYASKHNIVSSNFNTSNNLLVTQNVGKPNSIISFLSDISGNLTIYGNLNVNNSLAVREDIDCSSNLTVENNITGKNNLLIEGDINCNNNLTVENDIIGKMDLLIEGNIDCSNNLTVHNDIIGKANLLIERNIDCENNLTVENDIIGKSDLLIQGNINSNNNLTIENYAYIKGDLQVDGRAIFTATPSFTNDINVDGDVNIDGNLYVNKLIQSNDLLILNNSKISGNLNVQQDIDCSSNLNVDKKIDVKGDLIVKGSLNLGNKDQNTSNINLSGTTTLFITSNDHKNYNTSQFHIKTTESNYKGISFGINDDNYSYIQSYRYTESGSNHSTQSLLLNPNGGNIGIGNNDPAYSLDVNGDSNFSDNMYTTTIYTTKDGTSHLSFTAENSECFIKSFSNDINGSTWSPIHFTNGFSTKHYLSIVPNSNGNSANIGINNSNPNSILDINGNTNISGNFDVNGNTNLTGNFDVNGNTNLTGNLDVTGNSNLTGNFDVNGNTNLTGNLDVTGNSKLTGNLDITGITKLSNTLNVSSNGIAFFDNTVQTTAFIGGSVPIGGIIMWNGTNAPTGWGLCDGSTYGTSPNQIISPDLRGRFILSSGNSYTIGQKQGSSQVTLGVNEIPTHTHTATVNDSGHSHTITDKQHNHNISDPGHIHGLQAGGIERSSQDSGETAYAQSTDNFPYKSQFAYTNISIVPAFTGITGTNTASTGINVSNSNVGGGQPHENMPPYYVLAYIIRIS
jgi:microcystin-dependent protein/cytoskeletal protein CcmA (bactofilin family)